MDYHGITIIGRLTGDPKQKEEYVYFDVASGFPKGEETTYFSVFAYGKQGENALKYLQKGAEVFIAGRLSRKERTVMASQIIYGRNPKSKKVQ
jgi:hypothetical protein